jgi:hypothetical protein
MSFQPVSMHSVRSSNQRTLVEHWNMLSVGRRFPSIEDFNPQARDHTPEQLIIWDVEGSGSQRQFRVRRMGLRAAEALGSGPIGRTMEELVPPALREISLQGAHECAATGSAIYAIISTVANGNLVDCERLLLPFGRNGDTVEHIIAALQLISFQGAVERQEVSRDFETRSQMTFAGKIPSDWGARNPLVTVAAPALAPERVPAMSPEPVGVAAAPAGPPPADKRQAARRKVLKTGKIHFGKSREVCTVRDLSSTGASIELARRINVPDYFTLVLEMESAARKCTVVWRNGLQLGIQFG